MRENKSASRFKISRKARKKSLAQTGYFGHLCDRRIIELLLSSGFMSELERRPIPDGRMRIIRLLTEAQKEALRALKPDGLLILNFYEIEITQPETWIEYWFDENTLTEDDLRALIDKALTGAETVNDHPSVPGLPL